MIDKLFIGTAGWSIPKQHALAFPGTGSHLERYGRRFQAVEINSSFYRPHRSSTYSRWAASVPDGFRFAVKMPRTITHQARLANTDELLDQFFGEVSALNEALGPVLVQLPPSLPYDSGRVPAFFDSIRTRFQGMVACEPRHQSWFTDEIDQLLNKLRIARVAADPAVAPTAGVPGGWLGITYRRLHGSPEMYYSAYPADAIEGLAATLRVEVQTMSACWCIFDNTALGEATRNAMDLQEQSDDR